MASHPAPGTLAPNFTAPVAGGDYFPGASVSLAELKSHPVVLYFYPKDDTPGCTTENNDFSALKDQFEAAGTKLLGVSKDPAKKHAKFIAKHGLTAPLATDAEEGGLSDALGVWAEKQMYGKTYMGMVRATYLVDASGKIAQVWDKVKVAGHAEDVLAAAKAL